MPEGIVAGERCTHMQRVENECGKVSGPTVGCLCSIILMMPCYMNIECDFSFSPVLFCAPTCSQRTPICEHHRHIVDLHSLPTPVHKRHTKLIPKKGAISATKCTIIPGKPPEPRTRAALSLSLPPPPRPPPRPRNRQKSIPAPPPPPAPNTSPSAGPLLRKKSRQALVLTTSIAKTPNILSLAPVLVLLPPPLPQKTK